MAQSSFAVIYSRFKPEMYNGIFTLTSVTEVEVRHGQVSRIAGSSSGPLLELPLAWSSPHTILMVTRTPATAHAGRCKLHSQIYLSKLLWLERSLPNGSNFLPCGVIAWHIWGRQGGVVKKPPRTPELVPIPHPLPQDIPTKIKQMI